MDSWRLAKSIARLRSEVLAAYPGTTFWTIGDQSHQSGWSDHNPNECCDVVCAADIKGDGGLDLDDFVRHLITNPHPNLRYVIHKRKIYQRKHGWKAEVYTGPSAHADHVHVSSGNGPDGRSTSNYDSTASWGIAEIDDDPAPTPPKPSQPTTKLGDKMPTTKRGNRGHAVKVLQATLGIWGWKVSVDGIFGPQTEKALKAFQNKHASPVDGIAGPITWNALLGIK